MTLEYCPKLHRQDKLNRSSHASQCHTIVSNRSGKANNLWENQRPHHILDHRDNRDPENYVIMSGENNGDEEDWTESMWKVPYIPVWSKNFAQIQIDDFTDMINDEMSRTSRI